MTEDNSSPGDGDKRHWGSKSTDIQAKSEGEPQIGFLISETAWIIAPLTKVRNTRGSFGIDICSGKHWMPTMHQQDYKILRIQRCHLGLWMLNAW